MLVRFTPRSFPGFRAAVLAPALTIASQCALLAQDEGMHAMHATPAEHASLPLGIGWSREMSGTAWLPEPSPMHAHHVEARAWTLMLHGAAFGQYDHQNGFRGDAQIGLIDWEMLVAARPAGGGVFRAEAMMSLQPLVLGASGYPELLQTGGTYRRARIVNRQHPPDALMAAALAYDHSLTTRIAASVYAAAVGEPALGPVAYMHRPSSSADPFAPIGHHWQDASHESRGVLTAGVYSRALKLEASVFNAREPLERGRGLDYAGARLDSYSARVTLAPNTWATVAMWGGYLMGHDPLETPIGMQRYGASMLTTGTIARHRVSAAAVWGLDIHHHGSREHVHDPSATDVKFYHVSSAELLESTAKVARATELTARLEQVQKSADNLGFVGGDLSQLFTIRGASMAVVHDFRSFGGAMFGAGARVSVDMVPETLRLTYQTKYPTGVAVYVRVR